MELSLLALVLLLIGIFAGRYNERKHWQSIEYRSELHKDVLLTQLKGFPGAIAGPQPPEIVMGEVVIASDYFKRFIAGFRKLIGGEVRSYTSMMERARREAILQLIERAKARGFNAVGNVRLETADVGGSSAANRKKMPMAAILATGTAYYRA